MIWISTTATLTASFVTTPLPKLISPPSDLFGAGRCVFLPSRRPANYPWQRPTRHKTNCQLADGNRNIVIGRAGFLRADRAAVGSDLNYWFSGNPGGPQRRGLIRPCKALGLSVSNVNAVVHLCGSLNTHRTPQEKCLA
jgi:hypothetical protein